jgi:hypothetical protein
MKRFIFLIFFVMTLIITSTAVDGRPVQADGKQLYENKCGRCHFIYAPAKHDIEEWKTIVADWRTAAGLDMESEKAILAYLEKESATVSSKNMPSHPVLSGYLYTEFFSAKNITDTFDIHYLSISLSGRLHDRVSYRAEFELEHGGGAEEPPFVEQAYLDVRLFDGLQVKIGAMLTPFNRFDQFHAPLENKLVTRPQMSQEIGVSAWKDVGVDVHGSLVLTKNFFLSYDAYVINGLGAGSRLRKSRHYTDNNDAKSFGFRLSGVMNDRIEAGGSFYHGAWDNDGTLALDMYGAHFLGSFGELDIFAEYSRADSENPAALPKGKAEGYFLQASYLLSGKWRPTVRYGTLDYLDMGNLLGRRPTNTDRKVIAFGLNYYLTNMIVFKAEYDFILEGERNTTVDNNLLALQAAIKF